MKKTTPALALALGLSSLVLINPVDPAQAAAIQVAGFADSSVAARHPNRNYAARAELRLDGTAGRRKQAFLKFRVPAVEADVELDRVTLRLHALRSSPRGISVYRTADRGWGESTLTWRQKPAERSLLGRSDALRAGTTEVIDLDPALVSPGEVLAVRLETSARTTLSFASMEAATSAKPSLDVTVSAATSKPKRTPKTTPTPDPTPTATPTPATGCVKPDAANTGATGALTAYTGPLRVTTAGTVIENKSITGNVVIAAPNVTIRNSKVAGTVGVQSTSGARLTLVDLAGFWVSSSQDVSLTNSDIGFSATGDAMHLTSDAGSKVTDVTISGNYVHDPRPAPGAHFDGLQVRGADRLNVTCNNFDLGAPREEYNAPIYLEPANGGHSAVVVDNNWLFGGAFGFMYGRANDGSTKLTNNHFGGTYRWQSAYDDAACYGSAVPAVQSGNDLRGVAFTPCS